MPLAVAVKLPVVAKAVALVIPVGHQGAALGTGDGKTERVADGEGAADQLEVTVRVRLDVAVRLGVCEELGVIAAVMLGEVAAGVRVGVTEGEALGDMVGDGEREPDGEELTVGVGILVPLLDADRTGKGVLVGDSEAVAEADGEGDGDTDGDGAGVCVTDSET